VIYIVHIVIYALESKSRRLRESRIGDTEIAHNIFVGNPLKTSVLKIVARDGRIALGSNLGR
jgi:hypothetical protein